jgi:hypothetical protein
MAWFIFIGDMLVMLFMTVLIVWVSAGANAETLDFSARIPLDDDAAVRARAAAARRNNNHG